MRIDKYLKVARVLKRRSTGKSLAVNDRLTINGRPAKAASRVNVGDLVTITFGERELTIRILGIAEHIRKEDASTLFEVVSERKKEVENEEENGTE